MTCEPQIRVGQHVAVLAGTEMAILAPHEAPLDEVSANFTSFVQGDALPVRLRVDDIDSPVINRQTQPPSLETVTVT
jgi:hypothetical protein